MMSTPTASAAVAAARKLPLFFAYCPDAPNALAKRLEARPKHWERWQKDREAGLGCEWSSIFRFYSSSSSLGQTGSAPWRRRKV
jgi:hypothetical protein